MVVVRAMSSRGHKFCQAGLTWKGKGQEMCAENRVIYGAISSPYTGLYLRLAPLLMTNDCRPLGCCVTTSWPYPCLSLWPPQLSQADSAAEAEKNGNGQMHGVYRAQAGPSALPPLSLPYRAKRQRPYPVIRLPGPQCWLRVSQAPAYCASRKTNRVRRGRGRRNWMEVDRRGCVWLEEVREGGRRVSLRPQSLIEVG